MALFGEVMGTVQVHGDQSMRRVPATAAEVTKDTSGGYLLRQHSGKREGNEGG